MDAPFDSPPPSFIPSLSPPFPTHTNKPLWLPNLVILARRSVVRVPKRERCETSVSWRRERPTVLRRFGHMCGACVRTVLPCRTLRWLTPLRGELTSEEKCGVALNVVVGFFLCQRGTSGPSAATSCSRRGSMEMRGASTGCRWRLRRSRTTVGVRRRHDKMHMRVRPAKTPDQP